MKTTHRLISFSLLFCQVSCVFNSGQVSEFKIKPYLLPCAGFEIKSCLQVSEDGGPYQNFYDPISGFQYQWGNEYRLRVYSTKIKNPPEDGSTRKYQLDAILDSTAVPNTRFTLLLHAYSFAKQSNDKLEIFGFEKPIVLTAGLQPVMIDSGKTTQTYQFDLLLESDGVLRAEKINSMSQ